MPNRSVIKSMMLMRIITYMIAE